MKVYQRFFLFLLLVLLLTSLLSPWVAALWNLITDAIPGWHEYRYPFSRIFDRLFMVLAISLFFIFRALLKIESLSQMGLHPLRQGYRELVYGFILAGGSFVLLVFAMSVSGVFTPYFRLPLSVSLERASNALLAALAVGLLEEIFFRGLIFKGLLEDWRPPGAFLAANLFYSLLHFVKPSQRITLSGIDPWAGLRHLGYCFEPFLEPSELLPGIFGLLLVGIVLSYAFLRTGSLYLSIGLHAGWIFGLKGMRIFGDYRRGDLGWIFGSSEPKILSGVATWIGILAVGVILHCATRNRQGQRIEIRR